MSKQTVVRIQGSIWEAITHIRREPPAAPARSRQPAARTDSAGTPGAAEEDLLLNLAIRHFREIHLSTDEANRLASAILHTVASGDVSSVGPVGYPERHYRFHRRVAAINIIVGAVRIRLPLAAALRLADALEGDHDRRLLGGIAA